MSKTGDFVHLHVHTDLSLLRGCIRLKPLVEKLSELEMEACAITDYANMFGAVSFYRQMKASGLKPIIGYEANLTFGSRFDKSAVVESGELPFYHLVLLAKDYEGYLNLVNLSSKAYTEGFYNKPRIDLDLLTERAGSLICLTSNLKGPVGHHLQNGNKEKARSNLQTLKSLFGRDLFLEVQDHGIEAERTIRPDLISLSKEMGVPLVATNDAHYLSTDDARAHEALLCIGEGKTVEDSTRPGLGASNFHLRSKEEMWALFGDDLPEALENTVRIANSCEVTFDLGNKYFLPKYPIPDESESTTEIDYLKEVTEEGFNRRKANVWDPSADKGQLKYDLGTYRERLKEEFRIIDDMGFPGYFLIVWEFVRFARAKGIPVGPGRGSAAGSLIAYCLEITDIDPIQHDLLFERFLNPERVSMPDIDIDFCVRGRGEVIEHVAEFYGRDSVCQIITFGTMASRASIKDVGRALNMPYADVERIAKLIPPPVRGRNVSIGQALEQVPELRKAIEKDKKVEELVDLALRLEGCSRHTSVHAAGVVISPQPLEELVPVAVSSRNDELTSQFPMGDLEDAGMLKMDFLALTTLTIINDCLNSLKQKTGETVDWSSVSLSDEPTLKLFGEGKTDAVFQFESGGMQEICRKLKPKDLEDLSALNALYRPGPLDGGMVEDFIARRRGEKKVEYIVPEMEDILENTFGILVYQEQIMQLAQKLAGYSLGEADMMRRAMGKKKRAAMAEHERRFIDGAVERGIDKVKAEEIYNLMAQFADYGFNRSHSVAYAYVAFQTAYLKAHYPAFFYAAVLSSEANDSAKIYKYANELRDSGLKLLPPDVNESDAGFTPLEGAVRFGLTAIKGIGAGSVEAILRARKKGGRFTSLFDFVSRIEQGALNRRALESLICAGAFDSLDPDSDPASWRARHFESVNAALSHGQRVWNDKQMGQSALFANASAGVAEAKDLLPFAKRWTTNELSGKEKLAVGFYLSSHPLDSHSRTLDEMKIGKIVDHSGAMPGDEITLAGMVAKPQVRQSRKGNRFCIFTLEDQTSTVKCLTWAEAFAKHAGLLKDDELLIVKGRVESNDGNDLVVIVNDVTSLTEAIYKQARKLIIKFPERLEDSLLEGVFTLLGSGKGSCEVTLEIPAGRGVWVTLDSPPMRISGSSKISTELEELGCAIDWDFG
ncbi:MAG: DNA polymerase III subunit alpha [Acidobacteria bacterium]|nr:MAG: DNA polymerase III subunit alpha [Acidobacteriota bacterium]REK01431.1 MAG: DNA polymerase III subunit alpha [Acidobacteriota bacterium]REK14387.1 MAG: DNA polymerase III subunit alpha [Acidobacteriota bacterium]REK45102.1 MAG: DNA polymerase III subunit alpha [Acidobacteriota bacterium]